MNNAAYQEKLRREATREKIRRGDFLLFMESIFKYKHKKRLRKTWFDPLIAKALLAIIKGEEDRLIISMPPRYGKTERAMRLFTSFAFGILKNTKIQYITYGQEFTEDTSVDTKLIMQSEEYRRIFPHVRFEKMQDKKANFKLTNGSEFFGTSIGGAITGKGSKISIIDDPLKADEADNDNERKKVIKFYKGSILSRMEEEEEDEEYAAEDTAIIVIMQRLHEDDLVGWLIKEQGLKKDGGLWTLINLPAINEEEEEIYEYQDLKIIRPINTPLDAKKHSVESLKRKKMEMGKKEFERQFQQNVEIDESGHFKKEDITYITDIDLPEQNIYISVDTAESEEKSADDRAISVVGWSIDLDEIELTVIMDGKRGKWDAFGVSEQIIELMIKYPKAPVHIEGAGGGITLEKILKKEILKSNAKLRAKGKLPLNNGVNVYKPNNQISKQAKIRDFMTAPHEAHLIKIHKGCDQDFQTQYINELLKFDPEKKQQIDNCIDSVASTWLFASPKKNIPNQSSKDKNNQSKKRTIKKKWRGI